jgi:hypothetical protein
VAVPRRRRGWFGERRRFGGEGDTRARARGARGAREAPQGGSARRASVAELCRVRGCLGSRECTRAEEEREPQGDSARRASGEETGLYTLTVTVPGGLSRFGMVTALGRAGCLLPPSLDTLPLPLAGFYTAARRETGDGRPGFDPRARAFLCATRRRVYAVWLPAVYPV